MKETKQEDIQNMDFETAFRALQESVELLESEDLSLEESLAHFERGHGLAKRCAKLLEEAELKVRQLSMETPDPSKTEE